MTDSDSKINVNFFQLVLSLQIAAVQQMGKIVSPITGKIERNLDQAKTSIDMLEMLSEKTRNNLSKEEEQFLSNILFELRMNYVDECRKPEPSPEKQSDNKPEEKS